MLSEVIIILGIIAAIDLISDLWSQWGTQELPDHVQVQMSAEDDKKIKAAQELIHECFGENVVETIKSSSNKERINLMAEFAEKLAEEYDLNIEVDVTVEELKNCGAYNWEKKKAVFNIALLTVDSENEHFGDCVRIVLDTIIHELRHAVQHKCIEEPTYWDIDADMRDMWQNNMLPGNYIRPEVDMRGYALQPIEIDASTFAELVMKGVC